MLFADIFEMALVFELAASDLLSLWLIFEPIDNTLESVLSDLFAALAFFPSTCLSAEVILRGRFSLFELSY